MLESLANNNIFFDSLILGFLAGDGLVIVLLGVHAWKLRHLSLATSRQYWALFAAAAAAFLIILYGSFIEPQIIVTTEEEIDLQQTGSDTEHELTVIVTSDWHVGPYKKEPFVERAVGMINELKPDLVVMAGDFLYGHSSDAEILRPLGGIEAPVYAAWGNHDYAPETGVTLIEKVFNEIGVNVVDNETIQIEVAGEKIQLLGLSDYWHGHIPSREVFTRGLRDDMFTIGITHNPDAIQLLELGDVDLLTAGHTHGGQIRLPFIGSIATLPIEIDQKYDQGLFDYENNGMPLFITRGIGEVGPRARLLAWPEIAVLRIRY